MFNEDFVNDKVKIQEEGLGSIIMLGEKADLTVKIEQATEQLSEAKDQTACGKEGYSKKIDAPGYEVVVDTHGTHLWNKETGTRKLECDCICRDKKQNYAYIQVIYSMHGGSAGADQKIRERVYRPFRSIRDGYPRFIISLDKYLDQYEGVRHINAIDLF